jgi:hypothetical protein
VTGGPGSFVLPIDDFRTFEAAMIRKLVAEIAGAAPRGAPATALARSPERRGTPRAED